MCCRCGYTTLTLTDDAGGGRMDSSDDWDSVVDVGTNVVASYR